MPWGWCGSSPGHHCLWLADAYGVVRVNGCERMRTSARTRASARTHGRAARADRRNTPKASRAWACYMAHIRGNRTHTEGISPISRACTALPCHSGAFGGMTGRKTTHSL